MRFLVELHDSGTTGDSLLKNFVEVTFKEKTLKASKIIAGTTDSAANMNVFGKLLENLGVHCHTAPITF